jgi:hypothetical protein
LMAGHIEMMLYMDILRSEEMSKRGVFLSKCTAYDSTIVM